MLKQKECGLGKQYWNRLIDLLEGDTGDDLIKAWQQAHAAVCDECNSKGEL